MFDKTREYAKFGFGRPPGTIWSMERAYFEFRRKLPGRQEYAYLRLALQSRYPDKSTSKIEKLAENCGSLDDAIVAAVEMDFGQPVATQIWAVLCNLPPCSRCHKYRALSTTDDLCYGCRKYPGFAACTRCHLYWDDSPSYCQRCGKKLWTITDGEGLPLLSPGVTADPESQPTYTSFAPNSTGPQDDFVALVAQVDDLEARCARVWNAGAADRRAYRQLRRTDTGAARQYIEHSANQHDEDNKTLVADLDRFFDGLCSAYLGGDKEKRAEIRSLMESNRRLLGNLYNYSGRCAIGLSKSGKAEYLLRGLAAMSIDDQKSCQDYGPILGALYRHALSFGLEPSAFLSTVAKLSDNETRGFLENFESSRDFAVFVRPYICK